MDKIINQLCTQAQLSELTPANLNIHYFTGRSYTVSGSGRDRVTRYRSGMQTDIGDVEENEWIRLAKESIHRAGEDDIQAALLAYVKDNCAWRKTVKEQEVEALELHCARIFENARWCDYQMFRERYWPQEPLSCAGELD